MLDLAIVDKLNRAGFVVAPYSTPEEESSVKSVSGPVRHVGEADKRRRRSWSRLCGSLWFVCAGVERASREGSSYIYTGSTLTSR